jgi:hypothetical protein
MRGSRDRCEAAVGTRSLLPRRGRRAAGWATRSLTRVPVLAGVGLLAGLLCSPASAVEVITNGGFETGNFNGWNVGIRPDRANGGMPSLFDTPSGWMVSNQPQTNGALSLSPISGASAFHGFAGDPAGLQFFLSQPMSCNNLVSRAKLSFTFDVVGGPQTANAAPRRFEVWLRNTSGHDRAKVFSYSVMGTDANPPQTVSIDIRSAFNNLGPTVYLLEFRGVVPEGDTGPALFVVDNVSLDLQDNRFPTVVCPPDRTVECVGPLTNVTLTASASDPDGPLTLTWLRGNLVVATGPTLSIGLPVGQHTFTFVATDIFGAMSMCDVRVTIVDTKAPVITCPSNITVAANPNTCEATLTLPAATAVDDCDPTPTVVCTRSDNRLLTQPFPLGTTTITCKATDDAGNMATCAFTVTVTGQPLTIACPPNRVVECGGDTSPAATGVATSTSVCNPPVTITHSDTFAPGSCPGTGTITRIWRAVDNVGTVVTCTQTILIQDTTAPTITCPTAPSPVQCPGTPVFPPPTVADRCDPNPMVTFVDSQTPGTCLGTRTVTRTWTARDCAGNTATCQQTVQVVDTTPPTLIGCPPSTLTVPSLTAVPPPATVTATDLCSGTVPVQFSQTQTPTVECGFTIVRTWKATDACGNMATCTQTITVTGGPPGVPNCPDIRLLTKNLAGDNVFFTPNLGVGVTNIRCVDETGREVKSGDFFVLLHTYTITCTGIDACGNTVSCTFTIYVFC